MHRFFRVLPGVLAQVGISGDPVLSDRWSAAVLQDEPVIQTNTRGTIGFTQKTGQPNSRTTMLYFNLQVSCHVVDYMLTDNLYSRFVSYCEFYADRIIRISIQKDIRPLAVWSAVWMCLISSSRNLWMWTRWERYTATLTLTLGALLSETNKQTYKQTSKHTNKQASMQTNEQTYKQTSKHKNKQANKKQTKNKLKN